MDTYGDLEVNGGTIRNLWVSAGSTLYLNGGELNNGSELNPQVPLDIEGTAYVTGGKVVPLNGQSVDLNNTGKMHILTSGSGALDLGNNLKPWTGNVQTENYKDVTVFYTDINGFGSSDGIYQTTVSGNTPGRGGGCRRHTAGHFRRKRHHVRRASPGAGTSYTVNIIWWAAAKRLLPVLPEPAAAPR